MMFNDQEPMPGMMPGPQAQEQQIPKSARKKIMKKALTGKSVGKLNKSRLLQIMAMNAAKNNKRSSGGYG